MKKRLFLSSAVMTGVLAVALSTGTYAWYTVGGQGHVVATGADTTVTAQVNDYNGLGKQMDLKTTIVAAKDTEGNLTVKGQLPEGKQDLVYEGDDSDPNNVLYQGKAQEGDPFTLPTYTDHLGNVDLTSSLGHTYANSTRNYLVDVTEMAKAPYGAFSFVAAVPDSVKLNKENLGISVSLTKVGDVDVGGNKLELTATVKAGGHVRLSKTEKDVFSAEEETTLTYTITLDSKGNIEFGKGVHGEQFEDAVEKQLKWTFDDIYYSVAPAYWQNRTGDNADSEEAKAQEDNKIEISWSSKIVNVD
jgi:hypothetical protein